MGALGCHRLVGLDVQHGERALVLRVADERPGRDVFGVARLGDVVRDVRPLRRLGTLGENDEDVRAIRRELKIGGRLPFGELVLGQRVRLLFLLALLLLFRFGAGMLDQLLLFGLDELLAVGFLWLALLRLFPCATPSTPSPSLRSLCWISGS